MKAFLSRGTSSQIVITPTGKIFVPTHLFEDKAFHTGLSSFDNLSSNLNDCAFGIEQVHPGYLEDEVRYSLFWWSLLDAETICGHQWF